MRCPALGGDQRREQKDGQPHERKCIAMIGAPLPAVPDAEQEGNDKDWAEQWQRVHVVARVGVAGEEEHAQGPQHVDRVRIGGPDRGVEQRHRGRATEVPGRVGDGGVDHR